MFACCVAKVALPQVTTELRQLAKAVFYGLCYGMGLQQLDAQLAACSHHALALTPAQLKDNFTQRFPRLMAYREEVKARSR